MCIVSDWMLKMKNIKDFTANNGANTFSVTITGIINPLQGTITDGIRVLIMTS